MNKKNNLCTQQEAIPGMGSIGGMRPKIENIDIGAKLAIVSVLINPSFDTHTGKQYTQNIQHQGVKKNGYTKAHITRQQHK